MKQKKINLVQNFSELSIIIPTLNEEGNIKKLLDILSRLYAGSRIIVADDGSIDKTQLIVKNYSKRNHRIMLLDRSKKEQKGLTASVIDAIFKAETKYFVVIDADMQHPPEEIEDIYLGLKAGKNLVIGSRINPESGFNLFRQILSKTAILLGNLRLFLAGKHYNDIMSGFFGAETALTVRIIKPNINKFEMGGYKILFEILKYAPKNLSVGYVRYNFGRRKKGESKLGKRQIISFLKSLFK